MGFLLMWNIYIIVHHYRSKPLKPSLVLQVELSTPIIQSNHPFLCNVYWQVRWPLRGKAHQCHLRTLFPDYIAVVGTSFCLSCTCLPATSPCFNVLSLCCLSTCDIHTDLILKEYQRVSHSLIRWITASCLMWKNHLKKFCTEEQSKHRLVAYDY